MTRPLTTEQAIAEATRKARRGLCNADLKVIAARRDFDALDSLSRDRALTEAESVALERAQNRIAKWEGRL